MTAAARRKLRPFAPAPEPAAPSPLLHEAQPVEVGTDAEGRAVRVSRGRVRPTTAVQSVYLYGLLQWRIFAPEVADGYERERVWLEPDGEWCRYRVVDRAKTLEQR